jgi:hypothetical protein
VDEDVSGLTFEKWDPSVHTDASQAPVTRIVNSRHLCVANFDLREVMPRQLESVERGGPRTGDTTVKKIHGLGTRRYVPSVTIIVVNLLPIHHKNCGKID